ncbi:acyl transferase/acyl hydrolase/lysophospholipase [Pyronema domesticum]|nr:acyl transferase/acyl hydrolase/lysophospholipase [Pyronema domesticum]
MECEACEATESVFWCHICDVTVCHDCWIRQAAHGATRKQTRGNHEQTDLGLRDIIQWILRPHNDRHADDRHAMDCYTKWFGVTIQPGEEGDVSLQTTPRYRELSVGVGVDNHQYPALISFVGETGAGKSTLISALMKIGSLNVKPTDSENSQPFRTPVIGNLSELDTPTSSDVHLFPDPATRESKRPLLFADCEGLEGGNKLPIAARAVMRIGKFGTNLKGKRIQELRMKWATGEQRSRAWMVRKFYPRILFTFSDCVCYVTKNFRTMEVVIARLIRWAHAVFQTSVNQPLLPYAIIIINALEDKVQPSGNWWWDEDPTESQLNKHINSFKDDPILEGLAKQWRDRGKTIDTLTDLINCYYCGIKIVCVPHMNSAPSRIDAQYKRLQLLINEAATATYTMRQNAELLMNSEELDIYFSYAFNHFSQNPGKPFDFLNAAFQHSPIEATFKYHIIKAATRLLETKQFEPDGHLFNNLAPLIASCILLDVCRKSYPLRTETTVMMYERFCSAAQEEFYQHHWPCNFRDRKGRRCVNVATKHQKGHQIANGKVVGAGDFISELDGPVTGGDRFMKLVTQNYKALLDRFGKTPGDGGSRSRSVAFRIQRETLQQEPFLKMWNKTVSSDEGSDAATVIDSHSSYSTCFSCLFSTPKHALTCGHVICDYCVDDFSEHPVSGQVRTITECPLCVSGRPPWEKLLEVRREPRQVGPRILSLDGGGVRSIMQLQILSIIEERIGLGIPIGQFFDLMVGTSAGGIIALGLGEKSMQIEDAMKMFRAFAIKAFTKRMGANIPGVQYLVEAQHHSQYESKGLEDSLKKSFGEQKMFGEAKTITEESYNRRAKVGVTMTSSSGRPYLVTNYNRATRKNNGGYEFLRAEDHTKEMKVWEAARATSAAPRYFKPFIHEESGNIFSDGALTFNNPIEVAEYERKMIWPDHTNPDFLLSLGTGGEPKDEIEIELRDAIAQKGLVGYIRRLRAIVAHQNKTVMNSELAWANFQSRKHLEKSEDRPYMRMNLELVDRIPRIDQVEDLDFLVDEATKYAKLNDHLVNTAANKLIASLFYLSLGRADNERHDIQQQQCKGKCQPLIIIGQRLTFTFF